jgi:hypothetical protein
MKRRPAAEVSAAAAEASSTATEVSAAAAGASSSTAATVMTASLRLRDQGRAGKQRQPIEFSFHDFDFLCFRVFKLFC